MWDGPKWNTGSELSGTEGVIILIIVTQIITTYLYVK